MPSAPSLQRRHPPPSPPFLTAQSSPFPTRLGRHPRHHLPSPCAEAAIRAITFLPHACAPSSVRAPPPSFAHPMPRHLRRDSLPHEVPP
uniref:Uncharacterized protein n=1 Tax=Zea mays TaxID=4577 RepID=A0A804Q9A5_MAIZE